MAKLFEASIQIVADDRATADKIEKELNSKLGSMKISDVFVREVELLGDIDDDDDYLEEIEPERGDDL